MDISGSFESQRVEDSTGIQMVFGIML
jgi:hypothetical protein